MKRLFSRQLKKVLSVCMIFIMVITLFGCDSVSDSGNEQDTSNPSSETGTLQLYHATNDSVEPDENRYQLKQPDNLAAALEEVIEEITLDAGMSIERYSIDEEKNITLYIKENAKLSEEALLLNQAAVVRSINGLGVGSVAIILTDENGNAVEAATYTDSSFYYYDTH